jgi:hypothetical protein
MKYLKIFEDFKDNISQCDGSKYFDMKGISNIYSAYENPLYSLVYKRKIEELTYMSPKQYIYTIARNFGNLSYDDALSHVSDEKVDKYVDAMKNGAKFPVGNYQENSSLQEGRHRAVALMKLGCNCMPLIKITLDVPNSYINKVVDEIKNMSREEVNQYFIDKNYQGITDLDWRELHSYIKYQYQE